MTTHINFCSAQNSGATENLYLRVNDIIKSSKFAFEDQLERFLEVMLPMSKLKHRYLEILGKVEWWGGST